MYGLKAVPFDGEFSKQTLKLSSAEAVAFVETRFFLWTLGVRPLKQRRNGRKFFSGVQTQLGLNIYHKT
jgi:hypothetical protein